MTQDEHTLAELGTIARAADAPPLSSADRDAMIGAALDRAELARPLRSLARRRLAWTAGALAAAAVVLLAILGSRAGPREANALTLASGDRVYTTDGAQIAIEDGSPTRRALRVLEGEALFDVMPLEPGGSFEVSTDELTVRVRGTVFVVERRARTTVVRVHEGRVEIEDGDALVVLGAGESYRSGRARERLADQGALASLGREVAARRSAAARRDAAGAISGPTSTRGLVSGEPPPAAPEHAGNEAAAPTIDANEERTRAERGSSSIAREARGAAWRRDGEPVRRAIPTEATETTSLAHIEALLAAREFSAALDASRAERGWRARMLEAHALVGLERPAEAARAYEDVARSADHARRPEAAYRAATLRSRALGDPRGTLAALDLVSFTGTGLEERALGMRALALDAAGDRDAASRAAQTYLERHPEGGLAGDLRALAE